MSSTVFDSVVRRFLEQRLRFLLGSLADEVDYSGCSPSEVEEFKAERAKVVSPKSELPGLHLMLRGMLEDLKADVGSERDHTRLLAMAALNCPAPKSCSWGDVKGVVFHLMEEVSEDAEAFSLVGLREILEEQHGFKCKSVMEGDSVEDTLKACVLSACSRMMPSLPPPRSSSKPKRVSPPPSPPLPKRVRRSARVQKQKL